MADRRQPARPTYTVTIRDTLPATEGESLMRRIRAWLKSGLRAHGLRCIRITEATEDVPPTLAGSDQGDSDGRSAT